MMVIGGDMNAEIIELDEQEEAIFGKHYLRASQGTLEGTKPTTLQNRRFS